MRGDEIVVPENVRRFEICLYASLLVDTLSFPFRTIPEDVPESVIAMSALMSASLILLLCHLVWLAARQRRNWARWLLVMALGLSVLTLIGILNQEGWSLVTMIDAASAALTMVGLRLSFTGDARGWFV